MKRSYTKKQKQLIRNITIAVAVICLLVELVGMIPGVPFNGWEDIGVALGLMPSPVIPEGELEVHFIDVHNADCILVRQGDKNLLIDAGERDNQEDILGYLQEQGIQKLDMVIYVICNGIVAMKEDFPAGGVPESSENADASKNLRRKKYV